MDWYDQINEESIILSVDNIINQLLNTYTVSTYGHLCRKKKVIYWFDLIFQNNEKI